MAKIFIAFESVCEKGNGQELTISLDGIAIPFKGWPIVAVQKTHSSVRYDNNPFFGRHQDLINLWNGFLRCVFDSCYSKHAFQPLRKECICWSTGQNRSGHWSHDRVTSDPLGQIMKSAVITFGTVIFVRSVAQSPGKHNVTRNVKIDDECKWI